jgi:hypothetical protein
MEKQRNIVKASSKANLSGKEGYVQQFLTLKEVKKQVFFKMSMPSKIFHEATIPISSLLL